MPLLEIPAHDIDTAGLKVDVELPVQWLDRELREADVKSAEPGRLAARISRSGNDIVVRGEAGASVSLACARCLSLTSVDLRADLALLLKPLPGAHRPPGRSAGVPSARRGAARDRGAGRDVPGSNGGAVWARAAARAIPEWDQAQRGKAAVEAGRTGDPGRGSSPGRKGKEPEYEFASEEAEFDTYDGETVVLDAFVREALLLELPNFPLCSEACPGIRPVAPASEADSGEPGDRVDPRLAPLGALRAKLGRQKPAAGRGPEPAARPSVRKAKPGASVKKKTTKRNKE